MNENNYAYALHESYKVYDGCDLHQAAFDTSVFRNPVHYTVVSNAKILGFGAHYTYEYSKVKENLPK